MILKRRRETYERNEKKCVKTSLKKGWKRNRDIEARERDALKGRKESVRNEDIK